MPGKIEYIIANGEKNPISVADMEVRAQRCSDPWVRSRMRETVNAASRGDVAALAAKGFRPWAEEEELSYSDGFGMGLARTTGL